MNVGIKPSYKLFIDDERFPVTNDWVIARSSDEAIAMVTMHGMPTEISFDHDLGGDDTSRLFIMWMVDALLDGLITIPEGFTFSVHSQNPIGAEWIRSTMRGIISEFS